jgi:hypothetical protein
MAPGCCREDRREVGFEEVNVPRAQKTRPMPKDDAVKRPAITENDAAG